MRKFVLITGGIFSVVSVLMLTIVVVLWRASSVSVAITKTPLDPINIHSTEHKPSKVYSTSQSGLKVNLQFGNDQISSANKSGYFLLSLIPDEQLIKSLVVKKQPLNLAIIIDHSGSMSGDKLANVKSALIKVSEMLSPEDYVSIVMYDDTVETIYETGKFNQERFRSVINGISADGSTNVEGGLREGIKNLTNSYRSGYLHRAILLSDGLANAGISSADGLANIVKEITREGITISTVGVGSDYDENLMTKVALAGRGNYYFLQNSEKAAELFGREFNSLQQTIAKDIKIEFLFKNGYKVVRGIGYDLKHPDFFQPFDIYQGTNRSYMFQFEGNGSSELGAIKVSYTSLIDNKQTSFEVPLTMEIVSGEINPLADDLLYREFMRSYIAEQMWTVDQDLNQVKNKEALDTIARTKTELDKATSRLPNEFGAEVQSLDQKQKFIQQLGSQSVNDTVDGRNFKKENQSGSYQQIYNK